jgi:peptidoglycan/xylan/chitin deacetylase (PgdA/CDA1 family)
VSLVRSERTITVRRPFCLPALLFLRLIIGWMCMQAAGTTGIAKEPIPEKLVVLTFDDSAKSHFTIVRPLLLQYGFGATFFITEGFDFRDNKKDYMSWEEIAQLHKDGFEIGNHTRDHLGISDRTIDKLSEQLEGINARCTEYGIPKPASFAWPGNSLSRNALKPLRENGIRFARRGGGPEYPYEKGQGFALEPMLDHPLLIPSAGDARPDWELEDFVDAVKQAQFGRIAVLQFHGVPDTAHSWVNTPQAKFESYMRYLAAEGYRVIAMRDLEKYIDPNVMPSDPFGVIEDRKARMAIAQPHDMFRKPTSDADLSFWLRNMIVDHGYSIVEASAATGLSTKELQAAKEKLRVVDRVELPSNRIRALPYPGGRHPRIGFRDGAIRPQRETKLSLFLPWDQASYVVADFPEAIWWKQQGQRELMFLAHTHVKTTWDRKNQSIPESEWTQTKNGWSVTRTLPNGVKFGCDAISEANEVKFELWIQNGSPEVLSGLMVQNCVMLAHAKGYEELTLDNKLIRGGLVACHDETKSKWIVTGWQRCVRPWANPPCPCMHSDPQFEDIAPKEKRTLKGIVSFYEGLEIIEEMDRLQIQLDGL